MKLIIGFQKHDKNIDDIYLLPSICYSKYNSPNGRGWGFGIGFKFLKIILMIRVFQPIVQQPLSDNNSDYPSFEDVIDHIPSIMDKKEIKYVKQVYKSIKKLDKFHRLVGKA